jgi:hypothetical protein
MKPKPGTATKLSMEVVDPQKFGVRDLNWWSWMLGSACVLGRHALRCIPADLGCGERVVRAARVCAVAKER